MRKAEQPWLGKELMAISTMLRRCVDRGSCQAVALSPMQGMVLHFISQADREIYQRDVEQAFGIRRSTASGLLKELETAGYLCREPVLRDARLKKLVMTERCCQMQQEIDRNVEQAEARMCAALTKEEQLQLYTLLGKLKTALGRDVPGKEESK